MSLLSKLAVISLCLASLGFFSGNDAIKVEVDKQDVRTGEIFSCKITVEGDFSELKLTLPDFKGFKIVSQSQSRNYSFKKGQEQTTITFTYLLFAQKPGKYTIDPVIVEGKEQKHQSSPIIIKVKGQALEKDKKILPYIEKSTEI